MEEGTSVRMEDMLVLNNDQLQFSFPDLHPQASCIITFKRTLRIPDQRGLVSGLPPSLGNFPVRELAQFKDKLTPETAARGGVALPIHQSEAMWVSFATNYVQEHGTGYPFAVKISAGKRSAVTGKEWSVTLREGDYVILPKQPWIDGFVDANGTVRQFVAMPLGLGVTVEEQITGSAEFGGLQIEVYPMKPDAFLRHHPKTPVREYRTRGGLESFGGGDTTLSFGGSMTRGASASTEPQSMGMAAGGAMTQEIYADTYGIESWDLVHSSRTFVHLFSARSWQTLTGSMPPTMPLTEAQYRSYKYPWYNHYAEGPTIPASPELAKVKSVAEIQAETGLPLLPENKTGLGSGNW